MYIGKKLWYRSPFSYKLFMTWLSEPRYKSVVSFQIPWTLCVKVGILYAPNRLKSAVFIDWNCLALQGYIYTIWKIWYWKYWLLKKNTKIQFFSVVSPSSCPVSSQKHTYPLFPENETQFRTYSMRCEIRHTELIDNRQSCAIYVYYYVTFYHGKVCLLWQS